MEVKMSNTISEGVEFFGDVQMGENNHFAPGCKIFGPITIGSNNYFGSYCVIGLAGQDETLSLELHSATNQGFGSTLDTIEIGNNNIFREFSTVHRGINGKTSVADHVYVMTYANISHNSNIHAHVKLASNVQMGGYTTIFQNSYIGMSAVLHQFSIVGAFSMVGMGSIVTKDIRVGSKAYGSPCREVGANMIALNRIGISDDSWWSLENQFRREEVPRNLISHIKDYDSETIRRDQLRESVKLIRKSLEK